MTENSVDDLHFGHFGELTYAPQTQLWSSRRDFKESAPLIGVGQANLYVGKPLLDLPGYFSEGEKGHVNRSAVRSLAASYLETDPAYYPLLDGLPDASTTHTLVEDDYTTGELLALGKIRGSEPRDDFYDIVAIPSGETGNEVRLIEMRPARQGWQDDKTIWLNTFELDGTDSVLWQGDGGRIRQLVFAQPAEDGSPLLAVRTATSVMILRPLYHRNPVKRSHIKYGRNSQPSRIDPNHVITIPSGHFDVLDVTFNPWYQRQFAAVNVEGRFMVWTLQAKELVEAETLTGGVDAGYLDDDEQGRKDGFYRLAWVGSASTLMVCSRRRLKAFDLSGRTPVAAKTDFLAAHSPVWVLDMRRSPYSHDDLFIVTSTHIIWLRHQTASTKGSRIRFEDLMALRHDRDSQDESISMSFRTMSKGFAVLLLSRRTSLVTEYYLAPSTTDAHYFTSDSDPSRLSVFPEYEISDPSKNICNLAFMPSVYTNRSSSANNHALGLQYEQSGYCFFQVLRLAQDFSLTGQLCHGREGNAEQRFQDMFTSKVRVIAPQWKRLRRRYLPRINALVRDRFVVSDDDEAASGADQALERLSFHFPTKHTDSVAKPGANGVEAVAWTVQNDLVYDKLCSIHSEPKSVGSYIEEVVERLSLGGITTLQTLATMITPPLKFEDLQADDAMLADLLTRMSRENVSTTSDQVSQVHMSILASGAALRLESFGIGQPSFLAIHRRLASAYLTTMSERVSEDAGAIREDLVKQIAAMTYIASIGVRPQIELQMPYHTAPFASQDAVSSPDLSASRLLPASGLSSSQAMPPDGSFSDAPTPALAKDTNPNSKSAIDRLRIYTSIAKPPTAQTKAQTNLLDHWTIGTDPSDYDWEETEAALSGNVIIPGSAMSASVRERIQRHARRRQEKEDERAPKRARLDARLVGSQPSPFGRALGTSSQGLGQAKSQGGSDWLMSSSQSQPQLAIASQVEPGRFGGRPVPSKLATRGRQGRKPGF